MTATWDRNTDAFTAGYRLHYGTATGSYQWSVDAGNQTSAPLNLSPGRYFFVVRAYNASYQQGPASSEVTFTVGTTSSPPTAAIQATLQSANSALVTWQTTNATSATINGQAVATSGSTTVAVSATTTFTLVARSATGATATASATVTVSTTPTPTAAIQATLQSGNALVTWQTTNAVSATINGVAVTVSGSTTVAVAATTTFTLVARSSSGATATASATVTVSTTPAPVTIPLPPLNMRATVSGSRVTLSWQRNPAGGAPTEYLLYVGTYSWGTNVIKAQSVGNVLTVSADMPRGSYYARVRARNASGISRSSDQVFFRVGTQLSSPTGFAADWEGTMVNLTWGASAADSADKVPSSYVLEAGTAPGLADVAVVPMGADARSFSADVPAGVYYVRLRAENDRGDSNPTREIVVAAPGTAPAPRALVSGGAGSIVTLSWAPPEGGEAPVGYVIEAGSDPGLSDLATIQIGNVTQFSTEAPPGIYFVRVRAVNSRGPGLSSNEVIVQK